MNPMTPAARGRARRFALQALYQMRMSACSASEAEAQFLQEYDMKRADTDYLHKLLVGVERERSALLASLAPLLDRSLAELDPIEESILLIGAFELQHRIDIPYKVVINEAVEIATQFGAAESHKFVNSVLDALARQYRSVELGKTRKA